MVRLVKKLLIPTIIFIWAVCYYIEVLGKKASAGYFIKPVFWIMAVLYVVIAAKDTKAWWEEGKAIAARSKKEDQGAKNDDTGKVKDVELGQMMVCVGSAALYLAVMPYVGFIIATILLLFGLFCWLKAPNRVGALVLAVLVTAGMYMLFKFGLKVPLYAGILGF
ncbi:hypothetical protein GPL15_17050 [Clostridium sp. MCC353]|uniref:tripartite tricarboxylate transporter TctB family protein n=1 Tax=Clostridium sp. MCC353 TaxID=2592646 RepID=UPI001C02FE26|nr:tripartite tricarboxylate transporter TctB family protein [Clostridium sp. MCC353]MBT9778211.1 hypothetical protein [Clostridium sp. MCC353]